ncbi:alpha/beta fold hydrolase [Sphingomonas sp. PB4P5]|uniref:alpha/beta fold hydrolase n=1 Tax=Parasphingomonas puruogangriensis TaxID=3096155 RepID=UPI002FC78395
MSELVALIAATMLPFNIIPGRAEPTPAFSTAADATIVANGIILTYRIVGPANGRPLLLIAGTGMQLIEWPPALIDGLVKQGFRVIIDDQRDVGGSTHFTATGAPDWSAIMTALGSGKAPPLPYTADDMARDAVALLDAVGIQHADLLGISGGATVAQLVAVVRPDRVRSLQLIAANSGNPTIPMPAEPARIASVQQPEPDDSAAVLITKRIAMRRALAGRSSMITEKKVRAAVAQAVAREPDPLGYARQGAALIALGDLRARLAAINVPTLVVHGDDDPLISPTAGREVAKVIPGATFLPVAGMGHTIEPRDIPTILAAIQMNAARTQ